MPNAFGFSQPGQQPTPDPRQVGQQLMQPQQQIQSRQPVSPIDIDVDPAEAKQALVGTRDKQLRREGGKLMGAGGDDRDSALSQAVGEALTRAGGGHVENPNPDKNRDAHVRQLQQLGISPLEAELLRETL